MPQPEMPEQPEPPEPSDGPWPGDTAPRYRSAAVARMARMPVATLRTWERRFQVITPAATRSGHRFYSAADVQRLTLLKQLSDMGHSISVMARLDMDRLREMAMTHASTQASVQRGLGAAPAATPPPWRVVVVGSTLARRLQRVSVLRRVGRQLEVVGVYDSLADCLSAARLAETGSNASAGEGQGEGQRKVQHEDARPLIELLLVGTPTLHAGTSVALREAADAWGADQVALMYGYGAQLACDAVLDAGIAVQHSPLTDTALGEWLRGLSDRSASGKHEPEADLKSLGPAWFEQAAPEPRRYDDTTLSDIAGLSSTVACECPRHVADLLMQLSHFEAYSAECSSRSREDAELHRYLQRASAAARAIFEVALERIAVHEGLLLPG